MKRRYLLYLFAILFLVIPIAHAEEVTTGRIAATNGLRIRSGPGTNNAQIGTAQYNTYATILGYADSGNGCNDKWAQIISSGNVKGYVCSTFLADIETKEIVETPITETGEKMAKMTDEEFEDYLNSQKFPESYKVKLRALHKLHPTWIFKGIKSNYNWNSALNTQDQSGTSLMNVNPTYAQNGYEGYLSTATADYNHSTDKFIAHDGTYWFQANRQTIAYYLDPRNFLDEQKIFMFEELFYYPSYQTIDVVKYTLSSEFLKQYANLFLKGAEASNVSPIYLAALSKQEVGTSNTNICTNGKDGTIDGVNYSNYYNFFNIGASSSSNPKLQSLKYAKSAGWDTQEKSIVNGSTIISRNYVNCGQYTSYFQKFNLAPTATKGTWHQYTTNISALVSPAISTYNAYKNFKLIEKDFVFAIPIYDSMPDSTSLPKPGNPNNWLKSLKVNGALVTNFNDNNLNYTVNIAYAETVKIDAESVNSKATIKGTGTITLTSDKTILPVVVTAQNGSTRTYNLTIIRAAKPVEVPKEEPKEDPKGENPNQGQDNNQKEENNNNNNTSTETINLENVLKSSGYNYTDKYLSKVTYGTSVNTIITNLTKTYNTVSINITDKNGKAKTSGTIVTGDKVIIASGGNTKTIEIVVYGDIDGTGNVTVVDLLHVQKHILGFTKLTGSFLEAADVNKDKKVTVVDILLIQKQLLGAANISQG